MSYLDPPRVHLAGTFFTNPSTINNSTENFSLDVAYNNNPPSDTNPNSVWWNPNGQAFFKVPGSSPGQDGQHPFIPPDQIDQQALASPFCEVTSVVTPDGEVVTDPGRDPLVQTPVYSVVTFDLGDRVKDHAGEYAAGSANAQYGRIADIDPDFQSRSMLVGVRLHIGIDADTWVEGTAWPMCIRDIWGRAQGGGAGGIASAGCLYCSVLDDLVWQGIDGSGAGVLDALYRQSPDKLSLKFVVDAYRGTSSDPSFRLGRLVGTVGAHGDSEPVHFPLARRLFTSTASSPLVAAGSALNAGYAKLWSSADGNTHKLLIDLGNSVPTTQTEAGPFADLGTVVPVWFPPKASGDGYDDPAPIGGPLFQTPTEYQTQYYTTAGIFQVDIDAQQAAALAQSPLGIQVDPPTALETVALGRPAAFMKEGLTAAQADFQPKSLGAAAQVVMAERPDGLYVDNDCVALRLQKGAPDWNDCGSASWPQGAGVWQTEITANAEVAFLASRWGTPAAGVPLALVISPNVYQFRNSEGYPRCVSNEPLSAILVDGVSPDSPKDCPTAADPGTWKQGLTTGSDGTATVTLAAGDLGPDNKPEWRQALEGQMYLFSALVADANGGDASDATQGGNPNLAILLFDNLPPAPANPTWWADVEPIMRQYARLYPLMKGLVDLSDYATVTNDQPPLEFAQKMQGVLNLPMSHPGFMPVTRDLSLRNRQIILDWYARGCPEGTNPAGQ